MSTYGMHCQGSGMFVLCLVFKTYLVCRQERRPFVRFFKLLSRKPEMQGNLFRYSKGRNTRFRVQNGCLHFCRASEEPTCASDEVREYCPDCAPNARDIVHQHPYSGRCLCRRSSPPDYSD